MLVDYHLHTHFSRHASGFIEEYIARACRLGNDEVCFTEHSSREYLPQAVREKIPWTWMQLGELTEYLDWLRAVDQTAPIPVRRGLEVDYVVGYDEEVRKFTESAAVDFVLGSIHFLPDYDMQYVTLVEEADSLRFLLTYFDYAKQAVKSRAFDSIAHLHLGWQAVPWPDDPVDSQRAEDALVEVVQAAKAYDVCLEINTRAFCFEGYGTLERYLFFLQIIADCGVSVTIGSDAHSPTEVGRNYQQAITALHRCGIKQIAVFRQRKRELVPLTIEVAVR